eukprot:797688-Rhodomonas_salina.3
MLAALDNRLELRVDACGCVCMRLGVGRKSCVCVCVFVCACVRVHACASGQRRNLGHTDRHTQTQTPRHTDDAFFFLSEKEREGERRREKEREGERRREREREGEGASGRGTCSSMAMTRVTRRSGSALPTSRSRFFWISTIATTPSRLRPRTRTTPSLTARV